MMEALLGALMALTLTITRCDRVAVTLFAGFTASVLLIPVVPDHTVALALCDLGVVYGMRFWCNGPRAFFVGLVGFAKILTRTNALPLNDPNHFWYAAMINAAFAAQLLIAGGYFDGLGDLLRRKRPRWYSVLEHVAR